MPLRCIGYKPVNKCNSSVFLSYFVILCLTMMSVKFYAMHNDVKTILSTYCETGYVKEQNPLSKRYVKQVEAINEIVSNSRKITVNERLTDEERTRLICASVYYGSLAEYKGQRPEIYYVKTITDKETACGSSHDVDFANLIKKVVYWPANAMYPELDESFGLCWNMGVWFPTRHLTADAHSLLSDKIILTQEEIDDTARLYTSHNNNIHSVVNIALAMHITDDINQTNNNNGIDSLKAVTHFIQRWDAAICQQAQNNKSKGLTVYRGAMLSPIGLFIMKMKKIFFLPTFLSTSSSEKACYWDPYVEQPDLDSLAINRQYIHNVKFVIDLSKCWNKAAVIEKHQTEYPEEEEVTLSCYNLYEYIREEYNENNK